VTPRAFDRARDTVTLEWPASAGARSYLVRIETPYGPRTFFTADTRVRLTGDLRNADVDELPRVFIPGFPQVVTVSAVDSNFYDWYRTHNDALSGTGLVSRVRGGIGVFGSLVRLRDQEMRVTAPQTEPFAGTFRYVGPPSEALGTPYLTLELYLESRAARTDQPDAISGRFEKRPSFASASTMPLSRTAENSSGSARRAASRASPSANGLSCRSADNRTRTVRATPAGIARA
jgi:hypothetical protein